MQAPDSQKHFFFAHSSYQVKVSQSVALNLKHPPEFLILIIEGERFDDNIDRKIWGKVIHIKETKGKKFAPLQRAHANNLLKKIISYRSKSIGVAYFSDLAWPLNNHLAYAFQRDGFVINLFEDGSGSYLSKNISTKEILKQQVRKLIGALLLSYRYSPFSGRLLGQDSDIVRDVFLYHPHLVENKNKVKEIHKINSSQPIQSLPGSSLVLILDQPLELIFKKEEIKRAEEALLSTIAQEKPGAEIIIKRHPRDPDGRKGINITSTMKVINSCLTAETVATELRVDCVFSFLSTALINIKHNNYRINCYSIAPKNKKIYKNHELSTDTEQLLKRSGVELIEYS